MVREIAREDYGSGGDQTDAAHEIADGAVPVYYSDLLELAAGDNNLATDEPELGPAFDGSPTPVNIIAANVYERLFAVAYEELQAMEDEDEEA